MFCNVSPVSEPPPGPTPGPTNLQSGDPTFSDLVNQIDPGLLHQITHDPKLN